MLFRNKAYRQYPVFRYLQYYLILIYTFGFYALWSQLWFRILFYSSDSYSTLAVFADFLVVISTPFLLAGKGMLVLWAVHLLERHARSYLYPAAVGLLLLVALLYLVFVSYQGQLTTYQLYAAGVLLVMAVVGALLLFSRVRYLSVSSRRVLIGLVLLVGAVHVPLLLSATVPPAFELAFIFLYFLGHTAVGVYFAYKAQLPVVQERDSRALPTVELVTFELFIEKYGITAREAEVVREIYQGKANKEIADQLFVTVQTIKDHTHRIYQKTNVKSRSQLASLMREFQL